MRRVVIEYSPLLYGIRRSVALRLDGSLSRASQKYDLRQIRNICVQRGQIADLSDPSQTTQDNLSPSVTQVSPGVPRVSPWQLCLT